MSKIDTFVISGPDVIGRMKLDDRRWAYGIVAPFDMSGNIPDLIGTKVLLDGKLFEIRGIVPTTPHAPVQRGELIELLVVAV